MQLLCQERKMHIINQIILVNLLLPLLIFAFPQPQSDGGDEDLDNRGLFVVDVLCMCQQKFYVTHTLSDTKGSNCDSLWVTVAQKFWKS